MDEDDWRQLLGLLTIKGTLQPLKAAALDSYEKRSGYKLPASYRHFCRVLGPGNLGDEFAIAVPTFSVKSPDLYDLESLNRMWHESRGWQQCAKDPAQFERGIIFGSDETGAVFLWDPAEPTERQSHEYAIYAVWRNWSHERLGDTFWDFARYCLDKMSSISELGFRSMHNVLTKR